MRRILTLTSLLLAATLITACGEDAEPSTITGADDTSDTVNDTASDDLPLGADPTRSPTFPFPSLTPPATSPSTDSPAWVTRRPSPATFLPVSTLRRRACRSRRTQPACCLTRTSWSTACARRSTAVPKPPPSADSSTASRSTTRSTAPTAAGSTTGSGSSPDSFRPPHVNPTRLRTLPAPCRQSRSRHRQRQRQAPLPQRRLRQPDHHARDGRPRDVRA